MNSMTGYAYEEQAYENMEVSVEIKSVNNRFLDLTINLPSFLNPIESYFHSKITSRVNRGKIDVFIRLKEKQTDTQVTADVTAAVSYMNAIKEVALATGHSENIPLDLIIAQPGVLNVSRTYDLDKYKSLIEPVFDKAFENFLADRAREGVNMKKDLCEKLKKLEECASFFKQWQPKMEEMFKEQITAKFKELLEDKVDENRIMAETAAMMIKYTINEEIVRLHSHISAMKSELENNPTPGKKIDFICQEMNREINTIGSKNQFSEVGAMVITAKDSLENIREQSKNVE